MTKEKIMKKWVGPFVAIVTPFDKKGRIMQDAFQDLVRSFIDDGSRGIVIGGHNGEAWNLKKEEMKQLILLANQEAAGRVPVLCGIEAITAEEIVQTAEFLAEAGASGIMVEPPYVVMKATDAELIDRFERIASGSPVPVLLYNTPRRTQIDINVTVLEKIAKHENIVAIKESIRDFSELTLKIQRVGKDINFFVGPSPLILPGILIGATGYISSAPMEYLRKDGYRLYELAKAGKAREAMPLHFKVTELYKALMGIGTWPAALKAGLNLVGRPAGIPRLPVHPLSPAEVTKMKEILSRNGILP